MSYMSEYEERNLNSKIPYDDIPISRRQTQGRKSQSSSHSGTISSVKVLASVIAILVIVNIALIITTFYYLRNSVVKEVNYNYNQITSVGDTSIMAGTTADLSSVAIAVGGNITTEYDFVYRSSGHGSGVILEMTSTSGYILTCYHVVDGYENRVYIMPISALNPISASVVGYSSNHDIAVLRAERTDAFDGCTEIQVFDSTYLSRGETCFAVGNPLGYGLSISQGVVSRTNLTILTDGSTYPVRVFQISAEINPGNSGGGLFNNEGKFIGLVNAKLHSVMQGNGSTISVAGMAYAIPSTFAVNVAQSIIENSGSPTYVDLGATFSYDADYGAVVEYVEYDGSTRAVLDYYVQVASISSGSIASGRLMVGDYIDSFTYTDRDGEIHTIKMYNIYSFEDICFDIMPNSEIIFNINRLSTNRTVSITASSYSTS